MKHARTQLAAVALSATCLLAACGTSGGSDAADDAAASTTTTTEAAETSSTEVESTTTEAEPTETTTTESSEGVDTETSVLDTLPDGDHYVYMAGLEEGMVEGQEVQVVIVDPVELLTGQAAIDAAAEDGVTLDTDYYIRDADATVKRIAVVPDAQVYSLAEGGGSPDLVPSSVSEVWEQEFLFKINVGNVRDITTISSIEAVYLA